MVTVIKGFDDFPNTLFMGQTKKDLVGNSTLFTILFPDKPIFVDKPHTDLITDIEHIKLND